MERRVMDDEELRKIKIRRTQEGAIEDVTDALASPDAPDETVEEEDVVLEFPEGEYDEDLVGLTPSQLQKVLAQREKAAREAKEKHEELVAEAESYLAEKEYAEAESFFSQSLLYDPDSAQAKRGLWIARTKDFTDYEPFYSEENALELSQTDDETRAFVRERAGERLRAEREELEREAEPLIPLVTGKQEERRQAFGENRKYYLVRFSAFLAVFLVMLVAMGISASFFVRTTSSVPVVICSVCGALAAAALVLVVLYTRKLLVATRLCRENEKLSSTEEGAHLARLNARLDCLALILDD